MCWGKDDVDGHKHALHIMPFNFEAQMRVSATVFHGIGYLSRSAYANRSTALRCFGLRVICVAIERAGYRFARLRACSDRRLHAAHRGVLDNMNSMRHVMYSNGTCDISIYMYICIYAYLITLYMYTFSI